MLVVAFGGISVPGVVSLSQDRINLRQPLTDGRLARLCRLNDCHLDLDLLAIDQAEVFVMTAAPIPYPQLTTDQTNSFTRRVA